MRIKSDIYLLSAEKVFPHPSYRKMAAVNFLFSYTKNPAESRRLMTRIVTCMRNAVMKCKFVITGRHFKNCIFISGINLKRRIGYMQILESGVYMLGVQHTRWTDAEMDRPRIHERIRDELTQERTNGLTLPR